MSEPTMKEKIKARLQPYYTAEEVGRWMRLPHPQLGGIAPTDAIKAGRADEVLAIIQRLDDAVYL